MIKILKLLVLLNLINVSNSFSDEINQLIDKKKPQQVKIATADQILFHRYKSIIDASYKQLGIETEYLESTWQRSARLIANQQVDGVFLHADVIAKSIPNLVKIDIPIFNYHFRLICYIEEECTEDILSNSTETVGVIGNSMFIEDLVPNFQAKQHTVRNRSDLLLMLKNKRLKYAIIYVVDGEALNANFFHYSKNTIVKDTAYHYVTESLSFLVDDLTLAMKKTISLSNNRREMNKKSPSK